MAVQIFGGRLRLLGRGEAVVRALLTARGRAWLGYACWCGLAIPGFVLTFGFEGDIANYRYGAGGWPRVLFVAMLFFATIQLLVSLRRLPESGESAHEEGYDFGPPTLAGLPVRTVVLPILYIALLSPVGFFVATPPFLAGVMISMGERRPVHIVVVTALIYALIILVFIKLLYVPLPIGTWPGFYEIGNWMLTTIR